MILADTIGENSTITMGVAIALFVAATPAVTWIIRAMMQMRDDLRDMKENIALLKQHTENKVNGSLTREEFLHFLRLNPGLNWEGDGH